MNNTTLVFGESAGVSGLDLVIIIVYFVLCLGIGIWIGASIFASDVGSGAIVGLAGTSSTSGIAISSYGLNGGVFSVLALAWFFVPVYIASGVYTLPEYLKKRFGGQRIQLYMSLLSLILYVFTKISADIYAGAIFIQQTVGWNMYLGICAILVITAIYTVLGGLKAVIYTDTLQTVIMIIGSIVITVISKGIFRQSDNSFIFGKKRKLRNMRQPSIFRTQLISYMKVGGLEGLYNKYPQSIPHPIVNNSDCGIPPDDAFHILRHPTTSDFPWPGNLFGITILGLWYFCSDQVLVQRSLAAKNMHHVKGGSIFAGYLKLTPLFTMTFPGMVSRVLFTDEVACVDPDVCDSVCGNPAGCSNIAYPKLVVELMPIGLKGLMLASMMAALMSSLTSVFNSTSTIFTMDIWRKMRPRASDTELLLVGKLFVLILVAISIVWIPVLKLSQGGQLFNYIQSVTSYLAPPVLSVFVMAIGWKRTNEKESGRRKRIQELVRNIGATKKPKKQKLMGKDTHLENPKKGAFWGLVAGFIVGVIRMGLDFGYGSPVCGEDDFRPSVLSKVHFLHFTIILFIVSITVTVLVSLCTTPLHGQHLARLTWWTRHSTDDDRETAADEGQHTEQELHQLAETTIYNGDHETTDDVHEIKDKRRSTWKHVLFVIIGLESLKGKNDITINEQQNLTSIREIPKWRTFVNVNAILLLLITTFLIGWFH